MKQIRVVLAIQSLLDRETVREELQRRMDFEIVAEVSSPIELLQRAELEEADAVILDSDDETEMPGVLTHVFMEFPRVLAIAIVRSRNRVVVYRQDIRERVYNGVNLGNLLGELRNVDRGYWIHADV